MTANPTQSALKSFGIVQWLTTAIFAAALSSSVAYAEGEQPFRVGIKIDGVGKAFTTFARKNKFKIRIQSTTCSDEPVASCQYSIQGNLALGATAAEAKGPVKDLLLVGAGGTDLPSLLISMGVLIGVFDPELDTDQRAEVLNKLVSEFNANKTASVSGKDAKYQLYMINSLGIFFSMAPNEPEPASNLKGTLKTMPGSSYIIVWKDEVAHKKALAIINSGVTEEKLPILETYVACRADAGTKVSITDGGFVTHDILILDGPQQGCRGNIPSEEVELSRPE